MSQSPGIEPLPPELIHEPLNWLFAEHYRHRQLCQLIERVGNATVLLSDEAHEILAFLRHDMPLH
nr:hemerythrin domain-containing protein [Brevundimonas sp.]